MVPKISEPLKFDCILVDNSSNYHSLFFFFFCFFILIVELKIWEKALQNPENDLPDPTYSITKIRLSKYIEHFTTKNWKFSDKNSDIFHIFAQNIDCGYSVEPPRRGGSNE